jgi:transketolase
MAAIANGLALSRLRPFAATCFVFSDYARPAMRLAALMELPVIFIFTHDAIGDGEVGPTHQPVEHLAALRAMPGITVLRPGDANEVIEAYQYVLKLRHRPAVLVLSLQPVPTLDRSRYRAAGGVACGGYVLADAGGTPDLILIATGSELAAAVQAHETLCSEGVRCRVVSLPSWDLFEQQTVAYRESVLPAAVTTRLAIEQGSAFGWERYIGAKGRMIGMHSVGDSAPLKALASNFGFDPSAILPVAREMLIAAATLAS